MRTNLEAGLKSSDPSSNARNTPSNVYVEIVEQPASKAMRFRYECEGRSAGSIPGANSTPENKTFPTIRVFGYQGKAVVVVSCVTKDYPHRPHPNSLVGNEACKKGVCTMEIPIEGMTVTFSNLGIRCVKKKDIESALRLREEIKVDPFRTGFAHRSQPSSIDLHVIRLCFQVFLHRDKKYEALSPVVSEPIFDKKSMPDLVIFQLSADAGSVAGGKKILLFCEKVIKEDIQVRFFEEQDGQLNWEGFADFQAVDVHRQVGIAFRTPRYHTLETNDVVKVNIQLRRPSDKACSEPLPFLLTPIEDADMKRKRQRCGTKIPNNFIKISQLQNQAGSSGSRRPAFNTLLNIPVDQQIKVEPRDISPETDNKLFRGGADAMQYRMTPSVCFGKPPSVIKIENNPRYTPTQQQQALNICARSPSGSITPVNTNDDFQNVTPVPEQHWNIPKKITYTSKEWIIQPVQNTLPEEQWNGNENYYPVLNIMDQSLDTYVAAVLAPNKSLDNPPAMGLSCVLDLDNQEITQLNSSDLADGLNVFNHLSDQLSENLSNMSITENPSANTIVVDTNNTSENMTDTRLTN